MLRWIIGTSLKFRFLVVVSAAAMVAAGIARLRDMPIDVFPEFAPPLVEIQTEGWGMSANEVEDLITIPLEESLKGTPELDVMRSKSVVGLSSIVAYWTIRFRLMRVPGVANVAMWGERIKALVVQVDPDLLRAHDVSLNQVMETTSDALDFGLLSYRTAGKTRTDGFIETRNQRLAIKHTSPGVTPEELARAAP